MFRCPDLANLANILFTEQGLLNLVSKLREHGPFANISPDYDMNEEVSNPVIMPKIRLKLPCEDYSTMEISILSISIINTLQQFPNDQSYHIIG